MKEKLENSKILITGGFNKNTLNIEPNYGPNRQGDVPHSLASVEKAKGVLNYNPKFDAQKGF